MKIPLTFTFFTGIFFQLLTSQAATWTDVTEEIGLGDIRASLVKFHDLNGDTYPDVVICPATRKPAVPRVFLHPGESAQELPSYQELTDPGLPAMTTADILVFADLDNDGNADAILGRYLDIYDENYQYPASGPTRNSWIQGQGDGTFGKIFLFEDATLGTTRSAALSDVNLDGLTDVFFGNFYERYGKGFEGFPNDLLLQYPRPDREPGFERWPLPRESLPTDYTTDLGGRSTYGVLIPRLDAGLPYLLELNYGRRWNRLYQLQKRPLFREITWGEETPPPPSLPTDPHAWPQHKIHQLKGMNIAEDAGVDGDAIRHGRHPEWPLAHAKARPRSKRADEPPFRANGNTFDASVGDIDNDGDFDLVLTTIIHAWAGESSDRSRILVNQLQEKGNLEFLSFERLSIDRIPALPDPGTPLSEIHTRYNQGDIYAEFADLNHDGRLDLVLCSSDYPDPPPHDERLRVYFQQEDGRFLDVTSLLQIDHVGAGQPSLADIDRDGDLDIILGQSFNRLSREQRRAAAMKTGALKADSPEDARPEPRLRVFQNNSTNPDTSITLLLEGSSEQGVASDAIGTVARLSADLDQDPETPEVTQMRQLVGPGGHAGKQSAFLIHFGLGEAAQADKLEITWPNSQQKTVTYEDVSPGIYRLEAGSNTLLPLP